MFKANEKMLNRHSLRLSSINAEIHKLLAQTKNMQGKKSFIDLKNLYKKIMSRVLYINTKKSTTEIPRIIYTLINRNSTQVKSK